MVGARIQQQVNARSIKRSTLRRRRFDARHPRYLWHNYRSPARPKHDGGRLFAAPCQLIQPLNQELGLLAAVADIGDGFPQIALHLRICGEALEAARNGIQFIRRRLKIGDRRGEILRDPTLQNGICLSGNTRHCGGRIVQVANNRIDL